MDMYDLLNFGRKFQDKDDQEWVSLKYLAENLHIAVKFKDTVPCLTYLVKEKDSSQSPERENESK
jgi:hypothetical protein